MDNMTRPEFRRRTVAALEALVAVETQRLEVEREILHQLYLMRNKNAAFVRMFLGKPVPQ